MSDWFAAWLIVLWNGLLDSLVGWLLGSLARWLIAVWLVGDWLTGWFAGWLAGWFVVWLVGWLLGLLAGSRAGSLVAGWLVVVVEARWLACDILE